MKRESLTLNNFIYTLIFRSFFSKRRDNTSLWVALIGVSIGICSLIAVIGTMNGMQKLLIEDLKNIEAFDYTGSAEAQDIDTIIQALEEYPQIELIIPFVDEFAILENNVGSQVVHLRALYSSQANKDFKFLESLSLFQSSDADATPNNYFTVQKDEETFLPGLLIGWNLSGILASHSDDLIQISLLSDDKGFVPIQLPARIVDVFYTGTDYDTQWAFISLEDYLTIKPNSSSIRFGVRVKSHRNIRPILSSYLTDVASWQENNTAFYIALKTEKIILILLSAVIFFVIIVHYKFAMLRRIRNKTDDIVALRTIGLQPVHIRLWFFGETIIICIMGTIFGVSLGLGFVYGYPYLYEWLFLLFGVSIDLGNLIGGSISLQELILVLGLTCGVVLLVAWIVVKRSASIAPMQVLRYE